MTFEVKTKVGTMKREEYKSGVLIGLSSSLLLFLLYIDPLVRWLEDLESGPVMRTDLGEVMRVTAPLFADDLDRYARSRELTTKWLGRVVKWGFYQDYSLEPSKTKVLVLNAGRRSLRVKSKYRRHEDRGRGEWTMIRRGDDTELFRTLENFRSIQDRSTGHEEVLGERIDHVLYNLMRIPMTNRFMVTATNALIVTMCEGMALV